MGCSLPEKCDIKDCNWKTLIYNIFYIYDAEYVLITVCCYDCQNALLAENGGHGTASIGA